jgi:superfamily II DNA helicase RecQ
MPVPGPARPEARDRLRRLAAALRRARSPWNGELLDARTLRLLADGPPATEAELAAVPGVGPALAERMGRVLLAALAGTEVVGEEGFAADPLLSALREWRERRARELVKPAYWVATDALLAAIAARRPASRRELARCAGVGPRFLAAEAEGLLELIARHREGAATTARRRAKR